MSVVRSRPEVAFRGRQDHFFDPKLTLSFCVNALICLKTVVSATV
jgi:hypothetical protein